MNRGAIDRALDAVALVALAPWLGGLGVLGAVVAPLVFGIVPAPASADAMTAVFRRFDAVAMACAAIVVLAEAGHALVRRPLARLDVARAALACGAGAIATFLTTSISPTIARLHAEGAIRGLGDAGMRLEAAHHLAESLAKTELALLVGVVVLYAVRPREPAR